MPPRLDHFLRADDDLLVERVACGDTEAFDKLMARHYHRATLVASQWCRDPATVPDVVAVSFLKAYKSLGTFRGECGFATWLHRIVFNSAMDANTRTNPHMRQVSLDERVTADLDRKAASEAAEREERQNASIARDEQWRALRLGMKRLPHEKQDLLLLCYVRQATYASIATDLGIAVGTVKSRLNRARADLRSAIRLC